MMDQKVIRGAVVLLVDKGKVLLVRYTATAQHQTGSHGLPGGQVRENESDIECAARKLPDETGLLTSKDYLIRMPGEYTSTIKRKSEGIRTYSTVVFWCSKYHGRLKGTVNEIPVWVPLTKLGTLQLLPHCQKMIEDGIKIDEERRKLFGSD
jgi:ADP-ribose pyrophosphatase YjhB (NUDIX family)